MIEKSSDKLLDGLICHLTENCDIQPNYSVVLHQPVVRDENNCEAISMLTVGEDNSSTFKDEDGDECANITMDELIEFTTAILKNNYYILDDNGEEI